MWQIYNALRQFPYPKFGKGCHFTQTAKRLDGFLAREITIVTRPQHPNMEPYMKDMRRIGRSDFNVADPFVLMGDKPPPVRGV